ncbi:MAG: DNA polymerase III subunit beta, partial [Candidatus Binatia bacterium]
MKFSIQRDHLHHPLQQVIGAVERRQTLPALAHVLIRSDAKRVSFTTTDLEIELSATLEMEVEDPGEATLPARKLLDICNSLPGDALLEISVENNRGAIKSGGSRFSLAGLPADDFPVLEDIAGQQSLTLAQGEFKTLLERTGFAMASQDVRYYLNGLMLEIGDNRLRAVATDGHRLAMCDLDAAKGTETTRQVIVPRKAIQELQRLLDSGDAQAELQLSDNHLRMQLPCLRFTSKLIDGRFPEYERVIPRDGDKTLSVERAAFRQALTRASILSNEKYRGIRLVLGGDQILIQAHNPEQEEAEVQLEANYRGEPLEMGFNVTYLFDVLSAVE